MEETAARQRRRKEQPAPETLRQTGPQEDGSLESGGLSNEGVPTDEVSRVNRRDLSRSPDRGVAGGAVLCVGPRDSGDLLGPIRLKRTPLYDASSRARRAPRAVRRLRDAGAIPDRHPGRACPDADGRRPVRRLAHGPGAADRQARTERGQGDRAAGARRHHGPGSPASSATRSSPTTPAASSTT